MSRRTPWARELYHRTCAASTLREILNACSSALRGSTYAKPGTTTIDGQNIVWGDNVVWGNNVVSGDVHQLP